MLIRDHESISTYQSKTRLRAYDPDLILQIGLGAAAFLFAFTTVYLLGSNGCDQTDVATPHAVHSVDRTAYATDITVDALAHASCPTVAIREPMVQTTTACEVSDMEWMQIGIFFESANRTGMNEFLASDVECETVAMETNVYGVPQQSGCPLEVRVIRSLAFRTASEPYVKIEVDVDAVNRIRAIITSTFDVAARGRQLKLCDAVLDCESCLLGFKVDWGCVRGRLRAAWFHMKNCGLTIEPYQREYCEQLARAALD